MPKQDLDRKQYRQNNVAKLNFWKIFADRPYVSAILVVLLGLFIMAKWWLAIALLTLITIIGIIVIGHSHHPDQVLSIEFHLKGSRKLAGLKAIQLACSMLMFLSTYMRQVVSVDFTSAGAQDGLQIMQGMLSNTGKYGAQGAYLIGLLNTFTGGNLWGSYRYAANSSQVMNDPAGAGIILWIFLLMIAPAFCVIAQFLKQPYSRRVMLVGSIVATISFMLTNAVMQKLVVLYATHLSLNLQVAQNAVHVGTMAYPAILCALITLVIAIYRELKHDQFDEIPAQAIK